MIFYVFVIGNFFKNLAKYLFEGVLFIWIHIATYVLVILIKNPLEAGINLCAFIHCERYRRHLQVYRKLVSFLLLIFGALELKEVVALALIETYITFGETILL